MENIKYYYVETIQLLVGSNNNLVLYFNLKTQKSKNKTNSIGIAFSIIIIIIEENLTTEEIKS